MSTILLEVQPINAIDYSECYVDTITVNDQEK